MESDMLAERILLDLENAFKKDPLIDEFDILPVNDSVLNKCPVILAVHKLGLESWCVRHVYLYVYTKFIKWRQQPHKTDPSVLISWTTAILLLNPDLETAWNCRKDLVLSHRHTVREELKFAELVLTRKPKSPQVFSHRKWILTHLLKENPSSCTVRDILEHELRLCVLTADKYSNNYYVWNHRIWIMEHMLKFCSKVIAEELQSTESWVSTHVSDHSGFHYRQFLIKSRFAVSPPNTTANEIESCLLHRGVLQGGDLSCYPSSCSSTSKHTGATELLMKELQFLSELQIIYPGHETLWNHRRFIIHELVLLSYSAKLPIQCHPSTVEPSNPVGNKKYKLESEPCLTVESILANEQDFLHKSHVHDNFWELELIRRHETWLKKVVSPSTACLPHV